MILGIIGPIEILTLFVAYTVVTITSIYFVVKNEKSLFMFLWLMFILSVPFVGGGVYLVKHFVNRGAINTRGGYLKS